MKVSFNLSLEMLITWVLIAGLILFCLIIWMKMENIKLVNQVNANTQSIQNIANFIQQNSQPAVPQQPVPQKPMPQKEEIPE